MFDLLRDAANNQYIVALDVEIEDGKQNGLATRDVLQVEAAPEDAAVADAEDGDPAHVEAGAVAAGAVPVPLAPAGVALMGRAQPLGPEVGDAGEDLGPVGPHLLGAHERPVRMDGLLAAVPRVEAGHEGVQVVRVLGVAESLGARQPSASRLLGSRAGKTQRVAMVVNSGSRPMMPKTTPGRTVNTGFCAGSGKPSPYLAR
jgi:hypothetical protein